MENLINKLNLGELPYITIKDIEHCLRDKIVAKTKMGFLKDCFESLVAENSGLFVLSGGAAATCHINDTNSALKCLDFDYYGVCSNMSANIQSHLQKCVDQYYDDLETLTRQIVVSNPLLILKCYQNGAYKLNGPIHLQLNNNIKCIKTPFNNEFDLMRFALQVNMISENGIEEYTNCKISATTSPLSLNVFFVNLRIMKRPFDTERCIKNLSLFGNKYYVMVTPLQRVLNEQLMCLLKDIFTNKYDYKIERRLKHLKILFNNLPIEAYNECINDHTDVCVYREKNESINNFVKKILDINGSALGCRKLMYLYLTTDTFHNQLPVYISHYVNYPHKNLCNQNWKQFMSCIFSLY
ncbi:hypothetical protein [Palpita vitrealis nucleopolyhedrovirus]|uniref:Ac18 n=1 Tax=Palpita vitrealis nucleopolyhedrovirus TaxID=2951960 RepID=A0AAE9LNC4_9ABAC|nr:hypothetical protein [Palpita vitrealis nucleopolyhedrovirus]